MRLKRNLIFGCLITGVYSWIGSYRDGSNFPGGDDLNGAAQALVRLQDTYRLDMPSLAQGVVKPEQDMPSDISGKPLHLTRVSLHLF